MKTTQKQASTRLFKKLSALRATLSNEEREILDSLIVVEEDTPAQEVTAHKMNAKAVGKATSKATSKANEVIAHKMNTKAVGKATGKATNKSTLRITFDPTSEEYKIQE